MFLKYVECPGGVDYPVDNPEFYFRNKQHMYDYMCGEARKHFEARAAQVVPAAKDAIAAEFRGMVLDRLTDVIPFSAGLKAVYRSFKTAPVVVKVILKHSSTAYDAYDNVDGAQDILQNIAGGTQSRLQFEKMYALACNLINAEKDARETATQQFPNDGTPIRPCPIDDYMEDVDISPAFARANCQCSHSSSQ